MGLFKKQDFAPDEMEQQFRRERRAKLFKLLKAALWLWALWGIVGHFIFPESASWFPLILILVVEAVRFCVSMYEDIQASRERAEQLREDADYVEPEDPDAITDVDKAVAKTALFWVGFLLFLIWICGSLIDLAF